MPFWLVCLQFPILKICDMRAGFLLQDIDLTKLGST